MTNLDHAKTGGPAPEGAEPSAAPDPGPQPGDDESELGDRLTYLYEHALRATPEQIAALLGSGRCPPDRAFDRFLPLRLRALSSQYWTPLVVVRRVVQWLRELDVRSVVDIGSGAGKFCVAAALGVEARFIGIEQRPRLVSAARELAELFGVEHRTSFVQGAIGEVDLPQAQAYYLFNPFGENIYGPNDCIDKDVELSGERYEHDVAFVESFLQEAPAGTFLVTYNGFGGRAPEGYEVVRVDLSLPNILRMWQKTRVAPAGSTTRRSS